jgi:hypothetical protein
LYLFSAGFAGAYSLRFYPHYSLLMAPAAILLIADQLSRLHRGGVAIHAIVAALVFANSVAPQIPTMSAGLRAVIANRSLAVSPNDVNARIAARIKPYLQPGNFIYVYNYYHILYLMTDTQSPTRFVFPKHHLLAEHAEALGFTVDSEMANIVAKNPKFVITPTTRYSIFGPILSAYITENCRFFGAEDAIVIYGCDERGWRFVRRPAQPG